MNTNPTLQDRAVEAAARFLEVRGYETLATGWKSPETRGTIDLVARDPESDDLVFVDVSARPNSGAGFGDGRNDRETMELLAVSWLVENDFVFVNKEIDISLCRFSTLRWQAPTHLPS